MMIFTTGCGQKENLLPFGLEFGDSYEECVKKFDVGPLKDSNANDGYLSNCIPISEEKEIIKVLGTSEGVSDVEIAVAFNADKQLYEYYCFFVPEIEKVSEINDIIKQKYSKIAGEPEADPNGIALWKNEKYVIDYSSTDRYATVLGKEVPFVIIIHSFEYDFE